MNESLNLGSKEKKSLEEMLERARNDVKGAKAEETSRPPETQVLTKLLRGVSKIKAGWRQTKGTAGFGEVKH